jgi:hypothetical protein
MPEGGWGNASFVEGGRGGWQGQPRDCKMGKENRGAISFHRSLN